MAHSTLSPFLRRLRHAAEAAVTGPLTDRQLLDRFARHGDQSAFAALVHRHGGRVLAACRHVLHGEADVEDAFQATFLVLLHKAGSIRWQESVGGWLAVVAYRVAVRARCAAVGRRRLDERAVARPDAAAAGPDLSWREACGVLHEELDRLPDKYRLPLVLCYLEGRPRDEAAAQLGWSAGTVKGRLERGRERLRRRLERRGVTLSAGLLAALAAPARSAVPAALVDSVVSAVVTQSAAAGGNAALLAHGVLHAMRLKYVQAAATVLVLAGILGIGLGDRALRAQGEKSPTLADPPPAAVPAAPTVKVVIRARVLDPDGKPVAGAKLYLPGPPARPDPVSHGVDAPPLLQATTGPDGSARFETEPSSREMSSFRHVVAAAAGFAADWADVPATDGEVTLRLAPDDVPVRGRVVDLEGRPVAGAVVRVVAVAAPSGGDWAAYAAAWRADPHRLNHALTRTLFAVRCAGLPAAVTAVAGGRITLAGVGRDRIAVLHVEAGAIEHRTVRAVTRPGFDPKSVEPPDGGRMSGYDGVPPRPLVYGPEFVHAARPGQVVQGTVRDAATGRPVAGAGVNGSAEGAWWEDAVYARADGQGRYRLVGLPKVPRRRLLVSAGAETAYLAGGYTVTDIGGLGPITFDVTLVRGVVVTGRITDAATGRPVVRAGLHYSPLPDNPSFKSTPGTDVHRFASIGYQTDADGRYRVVVLPGPGLITAQEDSRGHPAGRYTQVRMDPADGHRQYGDPDDGMGEAMLTADGHIQSLIGQSAYKVIDPPAGQESLTLDLRFDPGRTVTGKVVGPDGQPLAGCTASGLAATWGGVRELTGAEFTAVALDPERPRTVAVVHRGRKLAGRVRLAGTEAAPTVKLGPCAAVTGRVLDQDGKAVAGAEVWVHHRTRTVSALMSDDGYDSAMATRTDRDGRFRAEGVVPGEEFALHFRLQRKYLDPGNAAQKLTTKPGEALDLGDVQTQPIGD